MALQTNQFVKYTDGTFISYQLWNNYLIKNQQLQTFDFNRNAFKPYIKQIHIAQNKLHPDGTSGKNCVVMLTAVLT